MKKLLLVGALAIAASSCGSSSAQATKATGPTDSALEALTLELGPGLTEILGTSSSVVGSVVYKTPDEVGLLTPGIAEGEACYISGERYEGSRPQVPVEQLGYDELLGVVSCGPWEDVAQSGTAGSDKSSARSLAHFVLPIKYWTSEWDISNIEGLPNFKEASRTNAGVAFIRPTDAGVSAGELTISVTCECGDLILTATVS